MSTSRREFLAGVSAAVAAGMTQGGFHSAAHATEDRKLGVALVGLGSLGTNQVAPALQKTKHCRLAAIVTGTPEKERIWS
ncbi:MAG: twin-arginine translocation signal domain-containing protein, partial [Planctomycetota bacterium]